MGVPGVENRALLQRDSTRLVLRVIIGGRAWLHPGQANIPAIPRTSDLAPEFAWNRRCPVAMGKKGTLVEFKAH